MMDVVFEKTLGVLPPRQARNLPEIEKMIKFSGLTILRKKVVLLRKDQAQRFFRDRESAAELRKANFDDEEDNDYDVEELRDINAFIDSMTSGHSVILIIAGFDAVSRWLELIGQAKRGRGQQADCINVLFGKGVLGSRTARAASKEIRFFFPDTQFEAEYRVGSAGEYLSDTVSPTLLKGLVILSKEKPQIPVLWLAQWLLENRPHEH